MIAATEERTMRGLRQAHEMTDRKGRQAPTARAPRSTKTKAKTTATTV
jgi:hypothetical protein